MFHKRNFLSLSSVTRYTHLHRAFFVNKRFRQMRIINYFKSTNNNNSNFSLLTVLVSKKKYAHRTFLYQST